MRLSSILTALLLLTAVAAGDTTPQFVHSAFAGTAAEPGLAFSWWTKVQTQNSLVRWGTSPGQLDFEVPGVCETYDAKVGFVHHVVVSNVSAETVWYTVGSIGGVWSEVLELKAPRSKQNSRVLVYGDMGVRESNHTVQRLTDIAVKGTADWVLHVGDIGYGDDYPGEQYEDIWNLWFDKMQPVHQVMPYMVLPGNHEFACKGADIAEFCPYAVNFTDYRMRFRMPFAESGAVNNMWWSMDQGPVHYVAIDTETDFPGAAEGPTMFGDQLAWLEADLAHVNRSQTPWIIAAGHRPIYSSKTGYVKGNTPQGMCAVVQKALEHLFAKYGVNVFFVGHVHSYERTHPVYDNKLNPQGTTHIVVGSAGNKEGATKYDPLVQPVWSACRHGTWGYGVLTVESAHTLHWEFHRSDDDKVLDQVEIKNVHLS